MARRTTTTTVDGVVVKTEFLSLREEVMRDFGAEFKQMALDSFDIPFNQITDIDVFRAHFKPERALVQHLKREGYTNAELQALPQALKDIGSYFARGVLLAILFDHGKVPGASPTLSARWDERDPVP